MATQMEAIMPFIQETSKLPESEINQEVYRNLCKVVSESVPIWFESINRKSITEKENLILDTRLLEKSPIIPPLSLKEHVSIQDRMVSYMKRDGVVLIIKDETFIARLYDHEGIQPDEEAEFYIEDINKDDLPLLRKGAIFLWHIGYHDRPSGRSRFSMIIFRRLPAWKKKDIVEAKLKAKETLDIFRNG